MCDIVDDLLWVEFDPPYGRLKRQHLNRLGIERATAEILSLRQQVEKARAQGFGTGYAIAVSNIMNLHGDDVIARDVLMQSGLTLQQVKQMDLTDYDLKPLRRLFRDAASSAKFERRARLKSGEGV